MVKKRNNGGKKKDKFGRIYREFTRVKFNKYKLQFPRLRESEIISKIIRQWDAMNEEAKELLEKQFIERSGMGFLDDESSSSRKRREAAERAKLLADSKSPSDPSRSKPKKKSSPKVRVFEEKNPEKVNEESDFNRSDQDKDGKKSGKKSTPEKSSSSHPHLGKKIAVIKESKISPAFSSNSKASDYTINKLISKNQVKGKKNEYLTFFKYYYERLTTEHPRWTKNQISTIIKLLWKKRSKASRREGLGIIKRLSGRQLYRRTKESEGFIRDEIKQMWKALPHESKKYWQIKGQGRPNRSRKDNGRFVRRVLNSGSQEEHGTEPQQRSYNWMENPIH